MNQTFHHSGACQRLACLVFFWILIFIYMCLFISVHSNLLNDRVKMLVHYKGRGRRSSWLSLRSQSQILRRAWQTFVTACCFCGVPNMSLYLTVFQMEYISVGSWDVILWHFIKWSCESIVPVPQILQLMSLL